MALYRALNRVVLPTGIVEKDASFESGLVPGSQWEPQDDDAKEAVALRDAAEAAETEACEDVDVGALLAKLSESQADLADAKVQIVDLTARAEAAEEALKKPPVVAPTDQAKRDEDIEAALPLLDEFDYVKTGERAGRPKCAAVENIVGYPVFPAELDAAWDKRPA